MKIVDVHSHLFMYKDDKKIEENIGKVNYIIENGLEINTNKIVLEESKKFNFVKAALGFHPTEIVKNNEYDIEKGIEFIENEVKNNKEVVAIGEIGLDYYWIKDSDLIKKEKIYFEKLLEICEKYDKPAIIHSRNAEHEVIEILKSYKIKVILHSFWNLNELNNAIENNFYISIPAFVYRDKILRKIAEYTPIDLILTETDSPFLDPIEKRNNNSWKIIYGIKTISEIKKIDIDELSEKIYDNFLDIFPNI